MTGSRIDWLRDGIAIAFLLSGGYEFDPRLEIWAEFSLNQLLALLFWSQLPFSLMRTAIRSRTTLSINLILLGLFVVGSWGAENVAFARYKVFSSVLVVLPILMHFDARVRSQKDLLRVLSLFAISGLLLTLASIPNMLRIHDGQRLSILAGGPNVFARLVGTALLASSVFVQMYYQRARWRMIALMSSWCALALVAIALAGTKAVVLGLPLAACVALWAAGKKRQVFLLTIATSVLLLAPIATDRLMNGFSKDGGVVRLLKLPDYDNPTGSLGSRARYWRSTIELLPSHALFGVGTGDWSMESGFGYGPVSPHNLIAEVAADHGLVGLTLVLLPLLGFPRRRSIHTKEQLTPVLLALVSFWGLNVLVSGDLIDSRYFWVMLLLLELNLRGLGPLVRIPSDQNMSMEASRMRIGILTSVHPPTDTRIYFKQARSLVRAGHEVHLVARDGGEISDLHYTRLPIPESRLKRPFTILRLLRSALRLRCDAYHIHDPELLLIVPFLKKLTGAQITFDIHENVRSQIRNKYWIPKAFRRLVAAFYGVAENFCLRWTDSVVLAEDSYEKEYSRWSPIVVRNYPILPQAALSNDPRSYTQLPRLAYCGVVARIRGGIEMLEATALLKRRFPNVELHVVGPFFPESFEDDMVSRIQELNLEENVRLYGRLPLDVALSSIEQCDVGLAILHPDPNYLESLPTKMFEYMSMRMPVVVSDFPLWRGIVEEARCGHAVDPMSPASIADAVSSICRDPESLATLGESGRQSVLNRFNWDVEFAKLLSIYPPPAVSEPEPAVDTTHERDPVEATPETRLGV